MSKCFQNNNNKKYTYSSDILYNKKSTVNNCNHCCNHFKNYDDFNQFNNVRTVDKLPFDKTNLDSGLYTKLILTDVCSVKLNNPPTCPTTVNIGSTVPFYFNYTVDPNGTLFGRCSINNYIRFRSFCKIY